MLKGPFIKWIYWSTRKLWWFQNN